MEIALTQRILDARGFGQAIEYAPTNPQEKAQLALHREQARDFMGFSLLVMAARSINYRGNGSMLTANDKLVIFERAFQTTSDFPNIFQNALNKALMARYQLATPTYRRLAVEREFKDFRPHPQIRAGDFPQLQPVLETGELKYASSTDAGETVTVHRLAWSSASAARRW
jgi:hypothetical protein